MLMSKYIYIYIFLGDCMISQNEEGECIDAQMVKQAVLQAINNWSESYEEE